MPSKEKEAFKSSKAVMRDHEGHNSLFIVPTKKENKSAFIEAFYCIRETLISTLCHHRSPPLSQDMSPPTPLSLSGPLFHLVSILSTP